MKTYSILLVVLLWAALQSTGQTLRNCSQILATNPSASSGIYTIDPDGEGVLPPMNCFCDMTTDGGGWTLILNYNHLAETNPALKIRTIDLPLQGNATLGFDESNTEYWGHADTALSNAIPFDEFRFYGSTSQHDRVIHFKSSHVGTISYFKTGFGSTAGISSDFTAFANHSSFLPASIDMTVTDRGNYAMTDYPLWTGSAYHWYLGGIDAYCSSVRWEVDDYPCANEPSTFHQIWVRQNNYHVGLKDPASKEIKIMVSPNPAGHFLNISFPDGIETGSTVTIYNNIGQLIYTELLLNSTNQINVSAFENGIYTLVIPTKEGKYHQKLIIQK